MKVLVDTNVVLSAALRNRLPERVILHIGTREEWIWLTTPEILSEYLNVLARPKFALPPDVLKLWSDVVQGRTICVTTPPALDFARDPKDAPFLAAALATSADYLITGDADLFHAQPSLQTRVISVVDFAALFEIE